MRINGFSFSRLRALIAKEFIQFRRDRSTFAMVISLPIVQLILFGLAINTNPKYLPTALINTDRGVFSDTLIHEMDNTKYFRFDHFPPTEKAANALIQEHQDLFTLNIPSNFSRQLIRRQHPAALLEVDGTDPVSVGYAMSASNGLMQNVYQYDLQGVLRPITAKPGPAQLVIHTAYNPNVITQYNIVPGLLGTVLTLTFVMVASMALTRERERGTMESLLSTPLLPVEVILGKSLPFLLVGYLQVLIVLLIAKLLFAIPMLGSLFLLLCMTLPFILASLFVGIFISTVSKTQLEASQISTVFFLPSMLLSGFAFPFNGMPHWAQMIGNILPLTHFINIIRGIMLKGIGLMDVWIDLWPILLFMAVMLLISLKRYRRTLD